MSSEVLLKVRERMQKIKDNIELAEGREHEAKESLKEITADVEKYDNEISSMRNRIILLKKELEEKNDLLEDKKLRSEQLELKNEQESEVVRELENVEVDEDQRMREVENELAETTQRAESMENQTTELRQKLGQLESEIQKVGINIFLSGDAHIVYDNKLCSIRLPVPSQTRIHFGKKFSFRPLCSLSKSGRRIIYRAIR